jgi:hypothetical protein
VFLRGTILSVNVTVYYLSLEPQKQLTFFSQLTQLPAIDLSVAAEIAVKMMEVK